MNLIQFYIIVTYLALVVGAIVWVIRDNLRPKRKLVASWSAEAAEELKRKHGLDMEAEIADLMSKAIKEEIGKQT